MAKKLDLKNDKVLKHFIKSGGRKGAKTDFFKVLKKSAKPQK